MTQDLQHTVMDIRQRELLLVLSQYKEHLQLLKKTGFDEVDDDLYVSQHAVLSQHIISCIEENYSSLIQGIREGSDDFLHNYELKCLFDMYYSHESDISICFMTDFVTAQHTLASVYRSRIAIADYIISNRELVKALMRFTTVEAGLTPCLRSITDSFALMRKSNNIMIPLFMNTTDALLELKRLVQRLYELHVAEGTDFLGNLDDILVQKEAC